jgi:hypothetical protein
MCASYLALGPTVADVTEAARMVCVLADAYRLADRSGLVDTILWVQERCWRGIEAGAAAGQPHAIRLRDLGIGQEVRDGHRWTAWHRHALRQALA